MYWDGEGAQRRNPYRRFFRPRPRRLFSLAIDALPSARQSAESFFPMPFQKHARITITNEGGSRYLYYNIDYRSYPQPLAPDRSISMRSTARPSPTGLDQPVERNEIRS